MSAGSIATLPTATYVTIGIIVVANISTIFAFSKSMISAAEERGSNKEKMAHIEATMEEIKKDVKAAHDKIRGSR